MFFKKTPVLESLFNKVAGLLFPVKFAKILRTPPVATSVSKRNTF